MPALTEQLIVFFCYHQMAVGVCAWPPKWYTSGP